MKLITTKEAQEHLRADSDDDSGLIDAYIEAASAAIYTYAGEGIYSGGNQTVRDDVKSACKLLVGDFYRNRESLSEAVPNQFGYGYLPNYVTALLFPYRQLVIS